MHEHQFLGSGPNLHFTAGGVSFSENWLDFWPDQGYHLVWQLWRRPIL